MEPLISALSNVIQAYKTGNSESTIAFLKYLLSQCQRVKLHCCVDGASYHRSDEVRELILNRSIKDSNLRSGKLPVFASLPMHQSRIRLRIFGCKENGWCESVTIFAKTLVLSSFF